MLDNQDGREPVSRPPCIKGEQGSMFLGDKDLGDTIHFELVSYNARWVIGSGGNDKGSKGLFPRQLRQQDPDHRRGCCGLP